MDTVFTALRVVVSLGAVFGALWFAHRWLTKGRPGTARAKHISVLSKTGLGAKAGVAVVESGGRRYLLGVTEHHVTVLDRLDALVDPAPVAEASSDDRPVRRPVPDLAAITATVPVTLPRRAFEQVLEAAGVEVFEIEPTAPVRVVPGPQHRPDPERSLFTRRRVAERAPSSPAARTGVSPLAGSILSPQTWRQAGAAIRALR